MNMVFTTLFRFVQHKTRTYKIFVNMLRILIKKSIILYQNDFMEINNDKNKI